MNIGEGYIISVVRADFGSKSSSGDTNEKAEAQGGFPQHRSSGYLQTVSNELNSDISTTVESDVNGPGACRFVHFFLLRKYIVAADSSTGYLHSNDISRVCANGDAMISHGIGQTLVVFDLGCHRNVKQNSIPLCCFGVLTTLWLLPIVW